MKNLKIISLLIAIVFTNSANAFDLDLKKLKDAANQMKAQPNNPVAPTDSKEIPVQTQTQNSSKQTNVASENNSDKQSNPAMKSGDFEQMKSYVLSQCGSDVRSLVKSLSWYGDSFDGEKLYKNKKIIQQKIQMDDEELNKPQKSYLEKQGEPCLKLVSEYHKAVAANNFEVLNKIYKVKEEELAKKQEDQKIAADKLNSEFMNNPPPDAFARTCWVYAGVPDTPATKKWLDTLSKSEQMALVYGAYQGTMWNFKGNGVAWFGKDMVKTSDCKMTANKLQGKVSCQRSEWDMKFYSSNVIWTKGPKETAWTGAYERSDMCL